MVYKDCVNAIAAIFAVFSLVGCVASESTIQTAIAKTEIANPTKTSTLVPTVTTKPTATATNTATLTPTIDSCNPDDVSLYIKNVFPLVVAFNDKVNLAYNTPRMSLAAVIESMQDIDNDQYILDRPPCAADTQFYLSEYMKSMINGFTLFLGRENQSLINTEFELANESFEQFDIEYTKLEKIISQ